MAVRIKDSNEEIIAEVIGQDVLPVVRALLGKENVSEFTLAVKIKAEINVTRNILYRLYERSLVSFIRRKDKKKGWYIYYWTFDAHRIDDLILKTRKDKFSRMTERLEREQNNQFFMCENSCVRLDFDLAASYNFKCPECNKLLNQQDNSKTIEHLKTTIAELKKVLAQKPKRFAKKVKKAAKKVVKKKAKKAKKKVKKKVVKKKVKKKKKR